MSDAARFHRQPPARKRKRKKADIRGPGIERIEAYVPGALRDRVRSHRRGKRISQSKLVTKWIVEGLERDEDK